ncbi:related to AN1-type zinc finger protein YOR052C [Zygosaccharomyces bailii]|nr:related to AN1-type zinc finger protein YOR052C [Zygosaccharomyces bailii]
MSELSQESKMDQNEEVKVVMGPSGVTKDPQVGSRVSKKGGKKKKNQCYFDKCTSSASKFIGDCNFCKGHFCSKHRLMETHACEGLTTCKEAMHKRNADKLVSEQTKVPKIQI